MKNKKENTNNVRNFIEVVKELRKTNQGRAILFFGFYAIFFIVVLFLIKFCRGNPISNMEINVNQKYYLNTSAIENNNYHFNYTVIIDSGSYVYDGDRSNDKELFTITTNTGVDSYYCSNSNCLKKVNNIYIKSDDPFILSYFLEGSNVSTLSDKATYVSSTNNADNSRNYKFEISTTSLVKIVNGQIIDIADATNTISAATDTEGNINDIEYGISSYTKYLNTSSNTTISLKYSNFGKIKEISKPE